MKHYAVIRPAPLLALFFMLFAFGMLPAQMLKPTPQQMRDNLVQVGRVVSIEAEGAVPFRLSATFATFDYLGRPAGDGTLEETWLRPGFTHRVITFRGLRSDQTSRNGSVRESHDGFESSFMERRIVAALLDPVPDAQAVPQTAALSYRAYKVPGGVLDCVVVHPVAPVKDTPLEEGPATAYCSDPVSHTLRLRQERYDFVVVYNNLVRLGGHTLAKKIQISQAGKLRATIEVTGFGAAPELAEKDFVIPTNTADLSRAEITLPEEVVANRVIKKKQPVYPETAKQNRISGTVFLSAVISKEGDVKDLDVISSPSPYLTESAIAAVKEWRYTPYLIGSDPQEVDTTIRVNYAFSK